MTYETDPVVDAEPEYDSSEDDDDNTRVNLVFRQKWLRSRTPWLQTPLEVAIDQYDLETFKTELKKNPNATLTRTRKDGRTYSLGIIEFLYDYRVCMFSWIPDAVECGCDITNIDAWECPNVFQNMILCSVNGYSSTGLNDELLDIFRRILVLIQGKTLANNPNPSSPKDIALDMLMYEDVEGYDCGSRFAENVLDIDFFGENKIFQFAHGGKGISEKYNTKQFQLLLVKLLVEFGVDFSLPDIPNIGNFHGITLNYRNEKNRMWAKAQVKKILGNE